MRLVRHRMSTELTTVPPDADMRVVLDLLRSKGVRHLPVVDPSGALLGLITDRDAGARALGPMSWLTDADMEHALRAMRAHEVMTDELVTTTPDTTLADAAGVLVDRHIGCLPVVAGGKLVGLLCESDLVREVAGR